MALVVPPRVPEPCFDVVPTRLSRHRCFATFFRGEEVTPDGFEGLAFKLGCSVGAQRLSHLHAFPVADLSAVTPAGGAGIIVLLALAAECVVFNAKRSLQSLLAPLMANVELHATAQTLVDRL
jgi:hypothetical protein